MEYRGLPLCMDTLSNKYPLHVLTNALSIYFIYALECTGPRPAVAQSSYGFTAH